MDSLLCGDVTWDTHAKAFFGRTIDHVSGFLKIGQPYHDAGLFR